MIRGNRRIPGVIVLACAACLGGGGVAAAQQARVATASPAATVAQQPPGGPASVPGETQTAQQTRRQLVALLGQCPPALGKVLKLDPSLLTNQAYLAPYPALAAFLAAHPSVVRDPAYFLADISTGTGYQPDPRERSMRVWGEMMRGVSAVAVFLVFMATVVWLIREIIDHKRWNRLAKTQVEVHNKLLDRFTANDDLIAYVQSPAGQRFLQSAPIAVDAAPQDFAAPIRRILWAVQAGVVVTAAGLGLLFVSGRADEQVQQQLFALGSLAVSIGAGFVLAAAVSFVLSKRLGLVAAPKPAAESRQ